MNSLNLLRERNEYAQKLGMDPNNLSQSALRSDSLITTGAAFNFNFSYSKPEKNVSENLLAQNDSFIVTMVTMTIKKISAAASTDALQGVALDYNYVNKSTGLFDGTNDANLQALFNGIFSVKIDNDLIFPGIPARFFQRVPSVQQGEVMAAIAGPVTYPVARDGFENALFGYYFVEPFVIKGDGKNFGVITAPTSYNFAEANELNYATAVFGGYLCQNENNVKAGRIQK